jgi:hypothetical protein
MSCATLASLPAAEAKGRSECASPDEARPKGVHEEGLEPTHLAVPEPKGHRSEQDAATSGSLEARDAGTCSKEHEGPWGTEGVGQAMGPLVAAARSALEELSQALAARDPHDVRLALAKLEGAR